jgi:phosphohistidine phosphatase SixA
VAEELSREWRVDVVRHADAGDRGGWDGPDRERPLSQKGLRQAQALVAHVSAAAEARVISSPAVRCFQTVEPLARELGSNLELDERLFEGQSPGDAHDFMCALGRDAVICSHGDIIGSIVFDLARRGLAPPGARFQKASTWRLTCRDGQVVHAEYLPPPK